MGGSIGRQSIDDFLKQHRDSTATQAPPAPSYIDSVAGGQQSYIDSVVSSKPSENLVPVLQGPPPTPGTDWLGVALGALKTFGEGIVDSGESMVQFAKYTGSLNPVMPVGTQQFYTDLISSQGGDPQAKERLRKGLEGAAIVSSSVVGEAAAAGIAATGFAQGVKASILKKGIAYLAAQEAGAATYAATAPVSPGETRTDILERAAWQFPATGLVMHAAARSLGFIWDSVFPKVAPEIRSSMEGATPEQARDIASGMRDYVRQVGPVPAAQADNVAAEAAARATKDVMRLGMPPDEQMARSYDSLRKGEAKTNPDINMRLAALAEQMRGRPFTRVEFDNFIKDVGEDGHYMAMRKWAEPPGPPRTTATAKAETAVPEGPDFTVEDLGPPPPPEGPPPPPSEPPPLPETPKPRGPLGAEPLPPKPVEDIPQGISGRPGLREDLGTPSEAQLQEELDTLVPKPKAQADVEAEARARVEEARRTEFPGRKPGEPYVKPEEPPPVKPPPGAREAKEPPWAPLSQEAPPPVAEPAAGKEPFWKQTPMGPRPPVPPEINPANREALQEAQRRYFSTKSEKVRESTYRTVQGIFKSHWNEFQKNGRLPRDVANEFLGGRVAPQRSEGPPIRPSGRKGPIAKLGPEHFTLRDRVQSTLIRKGVVNAKPITDTPYHVFGTGSTELNDRIANSWYAKDLTEALGKIKDELVQLMRKVTPISNPKFGGFNADSQVLGTNIDVPYVNMVLDALGISKFPFEENLIHFNPYGTFREISALEIPLGKDLPTMLAEDTRGTIVHEVAHELIPGEGEEHETVMMEIIDAAETHKDAQVDVLAKIWRQMLKDSMFQRHYAEVTNGWPEYVPRERTAVKGQYILLRSPVRYAAGDEFRSLADAAGGGGEEGTGLTRPLESGGVEPTGSYSATFGDRPYGGGEDLEGLLAKKQHNPNLVPDAAIANATNEAAIQSMTPEELLGPQEKLEAADASAEVPHEPTQRPPLSYTRQVGDEPADAEMDSEPASKSDETLHTEQQKGEDFWRSEEGVTSRKVAARLALLGLSGLSEYAAEQTDDPQKKAVFRGVSRFLAAGVIAEALGSKGMKAWIQRPIPLRITGKAISPLYAFVKSFDLPRIMTDGSVKAMDSWHAATQWGRASADFMRRSLEPHFPDAQSRQGGMYSIDEGRAAPEWHTLSTQAQSEVLATNHVNGQMLSRMEAVGAIPQGSGRAWYVSKLFEDRQTGAEWYSKWENLVKYGAPGQAQAFGTIRAAVGWAQTMGRDLPTLDPAKAQPHLMEEITRQMANHGMVQGFKTTGVLVPFDRTRILNQSPLTASMLRLRQVEVPGLGQVMATDEAATLLERAQGSKDFGGAFAAIDKARGVMMRSIMFWAWEHGINGARAAWAVTMNPMKYVDSIRAIRARDPSMLEFSKFADPYQRSDWGLEAQTNFDKVMEEATARFATKFPTLARIGVSVEHRLAGWERNLWNEWIPAIGHLAWTKEMSAWAQRTNGQHLVGSPEYNAFAKRVGEYANDAMGKIPRLLIDPRVSFATRQVLFSPNWTRSRINMSLKAGIEGTRMLAGELEPQDALYAPFKLRSVLIMTALTAIGSLVLTGIHSLVTGRGKPELPQFNPNTNKFYMRTGAYDRNNREIGFDMAGWYQDDTKMFNDPWAYLRDRQNPLLRTGMSVVSGRDVFGRSIEGMGRFEQVVSGLGPPGELLTGAGKMITGGTEPGDLLRAATGVAAIGNVSALPTMADANADRLARKILEDQGLPTDKDRVYQLGILLKRNVAQHTKPYEGDVPYWIASQKRQFQRTGFPWLWEQKKRDLRQFLNK